MGKRGNAYKSNGDYDRAIADYTEVIRRQPDSTIAYNNRGNAYEAGAYYTRAIADYEKALQINSGDQWARNAIARLKQGL